MVHTWIKSTAKSFFCSRQTVCNMLLRFLMMLIYCSFSVLPAISLNDGILHCDIVEGSFNTITFMTFINGLLDHMHPYPANNSVIVMDNCKIHKDPRVRQMIEERWVFFMMVFTAFSSYN